jgi:hypothetical protein
MRELPEEKRTRYAFQAKTKRSGNKGTASSWSHTCRTYLSAAETADRNDHPCKQTTEVCGRLQRNEATDKAAAVGRSRSSSIKSHNSTANGETVRTSAHIAIERVEYTGVCRSDVSLGIKVTSYALTPAHVPSRCRGVTCAALSVVESDYYSRRLSLPWSSTVSRLMMMMGWKH